LTFGAGAVKPATPNTRAIDFLDGAAGHKVGQWLEDVKDTFIYLISNNSKIGVVLSPYMNSGEN